MIYFCELSDIIIDDNYCFDADLVVMLNISSRDYKEHKTKKEVHL